MQPSFRFATPIFHPNIGPGGGMCFDKFWDISISKLLLALQSILETPDISGALYCKHGTGCLNPRATELFKTNREQFEETARAWTRMHAIPRHSGNTSEADGPANTCTDAGRDTPQA